MRFRYPRERCQVEGFERKCISLTKAGMSWSELERLVEAAEQDPAVRQELRRCRCREDLVLQARHLGFRITRIDLHRAWLDHQQQQQQQRARRPGGRSRMEFS